MYLLTIESKNKNGADAENNPKATLAFNTKEEAEAARLFYKTHAPMENEEAYIELNVVAVN